MSSMTTTQIVFSIVFPAIFGLLNLAITVVLFMHGQDQIAKVRTDLELQRAKQ